MFKLYAHQLVVAVLGLVTASCDANPPIPERANEPAQANTATPEHTLAAFAQRHDATPVDLFERRRSRGSLTAQLQLRLEDSIVAFRADLLDVVRKSSDDFEVLLGDRIPLSGTVVSLTLERQSALELVADHPRRVLIIALIDQVLPMTVELMSCSGTDCRGVELRPSRSGVSHRISGRVVAIEVEP